MNAKETIEAARSCKPQSLVPYYCDFVNEMTGCKLHEKSDIAQVLAWQAKRIAYLESNCKNVKDGCCVLSSGECGLKNEN